MANVYGEMRGRKVVCHRLGCERLAVYSERMHMAVACEEHEKLFELVNGLWTAHGRFPSPAPPVPKPGQYVKMDLHVPLIVVDLDGLW